MNIVHLIQHGGDAKEREEDLELGQKAHALRIARQPRHDATRRAEEGEPVASGMDERHKAAGEQRHNPHDQPYEDCDPMPYVGALDAAAALAVQIVSQIGAQEAPVSAGKARMHARFSIECRCHKCSDAPISIHVL